ncbi:MAG: MAPEG family protein [Polaromonas sp.]|jgi:uncharacterized MAPEG superfamily protein
MFPNFTIAYWCVLVMALLPVVCAGIAKSGMMRTPPGAGGYDNADPRSWLLRQTDWRARANSAQANTFEALPFFFAAVIIAHQLQAVQGRVDLLAVVFVVLRVAYVAAYVVNKANLRSVIWMLALLANVALLFAGFR